MSSHFIVKPKGVSVHISEVKMSNRSSNKLPNNLPQLQNLIKRDPTSYKDEFLQQHRYLTYLNP